MVDVMFNYFPIHIQWVHVQKLSYSNDLFGCLVFRHCPIFQIVASEVSPVWKNNHYHGNKFYDKQN